MHRKIIVSITHEFFQRFQYVPVCSGILLHLFFRAAVDPRLAGVAIGTGGIGSLTDIADTATRLSKSYKRVSPYFVPKVLTNMAAGQVIRLSRYAHRCFIVCMTML